VGVVEHHHPVHRHWLAAYHVPLQQDIRQRRQISGEGIRQRLQQHTVAADIELAAPSAQAKTLQCMYRSADGWAEQTCPVCLSELADGDMVRVLMVCKHCFHTACIEPWLREHDTCPLCRAPPTAKGV
jgi:hypothetical protein